MDFHVSGEWSKKFLVCLFGFEEVFERGSFWLKTLVKVLFKGSLPRLSAVLTPVLPLCFPPHPKLKSSPSDKEEKEAKSQLVKSDEIQRLLAEAHSDFDRKDFNTAAARLDTIIEVSGPCV